MTRTFLFTAACLALTLGCAPRSPAELTEDDREAIRQYYDELARILTPEDNEAWANTFTEDGQFMVPNQPTIRGREALRTWGEATGETGSLVVLSASFSDIEIHGSGDWAWVTTSQVLTIEGVEGSQRGRVFAVLRRQSDGTWLAAAAHVSPGQPPPGN